MLARKPGALPGATALSQARAAGAFTATHDAFWAAARTTARTTARGEERGDGGDAAGTRALIEVLLLHRLLPADAVITGMRAALAVGTPNPDLVAVEARRAANAAAPSSTASSTAADDVAASGHVLTLPDRAVSTALPDDQRPLPSITPYDQLLRRRDPTSSDPTPTGSAGDHPEPEEAV